MITQTFSGATDVQTYRHTDRQTDGQGQNIMPPDYLRGDIKIGV